MKITDTDGDTFEVMHFAPTCRHVIVCAEGREGQMVAVYLTPKQARKAANALHRHAAQAELNR